jgi:hypothetical protein
MSKSESFEEFRRRREIERLEKRATQKKKVTKPTEGERLPFNDSNSWLY